MSTGAIGPSCEQLDIVSGDSVGLVTLDPGSPSDPGRSGGSALELARQALRAEEAAAALVDEHCDRGGRLPKAIEARARELSRMSDRLGDMARRKLV